jgi:hypothetical protein
MIRKELYICVRFSEKASGVITDKDMKLLKKKMKPITKTMKEQLKPYDKHVRVWVDVFG